MTAYELLSEPIRRYVKDQHWEDFTPIQVAAIAKIMTASSNCILASKTASGKTEAAFLPILSQVDFEQFGVQVLYISPLIALINDQMERVECLCKYLDVSVVKWHGEANATMKKKLLESPKGIVLITPESLEALFQNKPYDIKRLFSSLKFVIVDEMHSYLGTNRGVHLKSLLHRLLGINDKTFRLIGLSATIGDYSQAKSFFTSKNETVVLLDKTSKVHEIRVSYFPVSKENKKELSADLMKNLYKSTREKKTLVFANSRDCVEETSVQLLRISEKVGDHQNYFTHHSSVARRLREYTEFFAKHSGYEPFTICCTSTLELGIDIGNMDLVVQIKAPNSVSSMIQRMGRSGRSQNSMSELLLYSTSELDLLQALACWRLCEKGMLETPEILNVPYDILLHQMLSVVKERFEISPFELVKEMNNNPAFLHCDTNSMKQIIIELLDNEMLEIVSDKLVLGVAADKYFSRGNFYSVFWDNNEYEVRYYGDVIGRLSPSESLSVDQQIYLAGGVWRIVDVNTDNMTISVVPSVEGEVPFFVGESIPISYEVEKEMLDILYDTEMYSVLDYNGKEALRELRCKYSSFIRLGKLKIPVCVDDFNKIITVFPFCGSKIRESIHLLFLSHNIPVIHNNSNKSLIFHGGVESFLEAVSSIISCKEVDNMFLVLDYLRKRDWSKISKFSQFLPKELQLQMAYNLYFDIPSAIMELRGML